MVHRPLALLLALLLLAAGCLAAGSARPPGPAAAAVTPGHLTEAMRTGRVPAAEAPSAEGRQAPHAADSLADLPDALATQAGVATSIVATTARGAGRSEVLAWPYLEGPQRPPCAASALA